MGQRLRINKVVGLGGQGSGNDDDVGLGEQLREAVHTPGFGNEWGTGVRMRVDGQDVHLEAFGPLGDGAADGAIPDDTHGQAAHLTTGTIELGPPPVSLALRRNAFRNATGEGEEERERVLTDGRTMGAAGIGEHDVAADELREV